MTEPVASVTWDCTDGERIDALHRVAALPAFRALVEIGAALVDVAAGALVFAVLQFARPDGDAALHAGLALAAAALLYAVRRRSRPEQVQRLLQRQTARVRRKHGTGILPCTIELHRDRLVCRSTNHRLRLPWRSVRSIAREGDDLVVVTGGLYSAVCVVRGPAFAAEPDREAFLALARRLAHEAGAPIPAAST